MSFSGLFDLNSATLQEHDLVPVHAAGGGPHVPDSSLPPPAIASDGLHLPSNSATLAKVSLPAKSGGVIVPTAETIVDGVDAEDGVEVLSTPQEPFVGMSFNTSNAAMDYYNSYA